MPPRIAVVALVAGLLAAGCGRVGFDVRAGSTDASDAPIGSFPVHWQNRNDGTPGALYGAGMTFDASRGTVLLYGGCDGSPLPPAGATAAMWELTSTGWTSVCNPCAPGARYEPGFAYDPLRDRVVLYGGADAAGTIAADTWEWDGVVWTAIAATGSVPGPLVSSHMVFDVSRAALVLLGGDDGTAPVTDVHTYINGVWSVVNVPAGPPIAGQSTEVAYDGARIAAIEDGAGITDHLWSLTGSTWSQLCSSCSGIPRGNPSLVYHPRIGKLLMMGGYTGSAELAGTWAWSGSRWDVVAADPPARDSSAAVYDPTRDVVVVYGGNGDSCHGPNQDCDETWELVPN